jgi:hypothetical protein
MPERPEAPRRVYSLVDWYANSERSRPARPTQAGRVSYTLHAHKEGPTRETAITSAMKTLRDGRGKTIVSPTTRAIADGEITDFSDWSVEELVRGQRRNKRGNWTGKRPKLLPAQLVQELARRQGRQAMALLSAHLVDAAKVIIEIAKKKKPERGDIVRLKAAEAIFDRTLGRPDESLTIGLSPDGIVQPWQKLMATSIISTEHELEAGDSDDGDIVEGELVAEPEPKHTVKRRIKRPKSKHPNR